LAAVLAMSGHAAYAAKVEVDLRPLERPDPASVAVPTLVASSDGDYAYFYKQGVSYEKAFSDLDECRIYSLETHFGGHAPRFVPLGSQPATAEYKQPNTFQYGVVGGLIVAMFVENSNEVAASNANRRCMQYKGYGVYRITRAVWKLIAKGSDAERLARLALIASGPQPPAGGL
jgi:hypothetical protein